MTTPTLMTLPPDPLHDLFHAARISARTDDRRVNGTPPYYATVRYYDKEWVEIIVWEAIKRPKHDYQHMAHHERLNVDLELPAKSL